MSVTSSNLIQGPAAIFWAPFGSTEPLDIDTAPAAPWIDLGGTQDGIELTIADEYSELGVDQLIYTPERRRVSRALTIKTTLAEATLDNLARAINNTAPVGGVLELDDGLAAFKPAYGAILLDGIAPGGVRRRAILRKTLGTDSVGTSYKKDGMTLIPVTWSGHWVSASIRPLAVEDAAA